MIIRCIVRCFLFMLVWFFTVFIQLKKWIVFTWVCWIILTEIVLFVSLSLSVGLQLMWFNCSSVLSVLSIPGGSEVVSSVVCT